MPWRGLFIMSRDVRSLKMNSQGLVLITLKLFCHHGRELLIADEPIIVAVRLGHHPGDLGLTQPLPHVGHHLLQLRQTENKSSRSYLSHFRFLPDKSIPVLIENIESLSQVIIAVVLTHFYGDDVEELWEVHCAIAVTIQLSEHLLYLLLLGCVTQSPDHFTHLLYYPN